MEWEDLGQVEGSKGESGESLDFQIDGDRVGIKKSETETEYTYTDHLTGPRGESLEFKIQGDELGIKRESDTEYTYTPIGQRILDHTTIQVVDELPSTGQENIIYLRAKQKTGEVADYYLPIYIKLNNDNDSEETSNEEDSEEPTNND